MECFQFWWDEQMKSNSKQKKNLFLHKFYRRHERKNCYSVTYAATFLLKIVAHERLGP